PNKAPPEKRQETAHVFSNDGRYIASPSADGIIIIDPQTKATVASIVSHKGKVTALAYSPDGKYFASGGKDKLVFLYDAAGAYKTLRQFALPSSVKRIIFSADGTTILIVDDARNGRMFDVKSGKDIRIRSLTSKSGGFSIIDEDRNHRLFTDISGEGPIHLAP